MRWFLIALLVYSTNLICGQNEDFNKYKKMLIQKCQDGNAESCKNVGKLIDAKTDEQKIYFIACEEKISEGCYKLAHRTEISSDTSTNNKVSNKNPGYMGVMLGIGTITSVGGGTPLLLGGRVGGNVYTTSHEDIAIGGYILTGKRSQIISGLDITSRIIGFGVELMGRRVFGTGIYGGARFGLSVLSASTTIGSGTSATDVSASGTAFNVGPMLGYELAIADGLVTIDPEIFWNVTGGTTMSSSIISDYKVGSTSIIGFVVGMKFLF